ncbi:MAG: hypothetical protein IIY54_10595 [Ruminococcus sp.]|nr:hypothetical protein [Ruminococcus sp.]MBQ1310146.1 hypothetical protein [Ruminococcus sp.]
MRETQHRTKKMDVVYFVREGENEELRYSLRSIERNLPHRKVWIIGGKPDDINPDEFIRIPQDGNDTKWNKVRANLELVATHDGITEDFVLMNDDFFVNRRTEELPPAYRGTLRQHYEAIERQHHGTTAYSIELRRTERALEEAGKTTISYELHIPIIINRKKLLETVRAFPNAHGTRTLYGNMHRIGGTQEKDVKIYPFSTTMPDDAWRFISSDDNTWGDTSLTRYIQQRYPEKSRFEIR